MLKVLIKMILNVRYLNDLVKVYIWNKIERLFNFKIK